MENSVDKKFSISVISKACGVKAHTLRVWEQRYQMFSPDRSESGQRQYGEQDLNKARLLAKLVHQGHAISTLAKYSNEELQSMVDVLEGSVEEVGFFDSTINAKNLLKYLADYQIDLVADELQHLRLTVGAKSFVLNVVLPLMREIGMLVADGKYSVTQEHIISTIIRDQLSQIYLPNLGAKNTEITLATPEGNLHELSIIIADILCRANRVSTRYLGAAHPADCLAEAMNALKSPVLVLGTVSSDQWNYHDRIIPYLEKIDRILKHDIKVILGGGLKKEFPEFKHITQVEIADSFEEFDKYLVEVI